MKSKTTLSKTEEVLVSMLKQNTGRHFLDSGGAYGRHFERNQLKDIPAQPRGRLEFTPIEKYGRSSIDVTLDVYHWLVDRLEYDEEMDDQWKAYDEARPDDYYHETLPAFLDSIGCHDRPWTTYTYNDECLLSQDIQFTCFTVDSTGYVALQIHNGCDARSGLTAPVIFRGSPWDEHSITDYGRAIIISTYEGHRHQLEFDGTEVGEEYMIWDTNDGGYSWEPQTGQKPLGEYEVTTNEAFLGKGKIWVDKEGKGYCPIFGTELKCDAF